MKLLLIEDDENIARSLAPLLKDAGYAVEIATDGERGYFLARDNNYDLIITDYNLPKMNGREIVKKIREEKVAAAILMLTVRNELDDKIDLLDLGADDYLTKPFAVSELLARIKALARRPKNWREQILKIHDLELDPDKFLVTKNNRRVALSSKEFALLKYLLENKGRLLPRPEIMKHIWGEEADPFSNTIEVHIMNLRKKLETPTQKMIFTVSNHGYKIDERS